MITARAWTQKDQGHGFFLAISEIPSTPILGEYHFLHKHAV
jgi:hypothetical protein